MEGGERLGEKAEEERAGEREREERGREEGRGKTSALFLTHDIRRSFFDPYEISHP